MTNHESIAISGAAKLLGRHGIEAGFLVPTATALHKGIILKTAVRDTFRLRGGFESRRWV